jgi:hypothetical protein
MQHTLVPMGGSGRNRLVAIALSFCSTPVFALQDENNRTRYETDRCTERSVR